MYQKILVLPIMLLLIVACDKEEKNKEQSKQEIENYLAANNLTAESTESGLYYFITKVGNGNSPQSTDSVKVNYKGYYIDKEVFDENDSLTLSLNSVIEGWREGIPKLSKGGEGTLLIPSHLGYGTNPRGAIRSDAILIFEVDLLDFWN